MITRSIEEAAVALRSGHLVAIPTETVYGLAADASSQSAVERIYTVKGRPLNHPVIVHISGVDEIRRWALTVPPWARALAETFWPGPLTLILPRSSEVGDWITGGQDNVGLRVPNHLLTLEIISRSGLGLAAPSANRYGAVSPTNAAAVLEDLGPYLDATNDLIFDGGNCVVGLESTIVDATSSRPRILRLGAVTAAQIEEITDLTIEYGTGGIRAPGTLENHYSPQASVHLQLVDSADSFIALAEVPTPSGLTRLAEPADVVEFAQVLYEALRKADALGLQNVVVLAPTGNGLAAAIRDRLKRAAASHPG
ncbi:MAG TPA: L-threonylcarbamoyladenylate synthase [Candidatus Nanopelagicaceae bacterium]|nr:L-threonylcarbamoyladenylate synthase [Candidatus Nanopelagicaceae bacterium]